MTSGFLRCTSFALGILGGVAQVVVAFLGLAIGGPSAIVVVLAFDALVVLVGVVLLAKWTWPGVTLMAVAGLGAIVALFSSTLLEIPVAALLLLAAVAAALSTRVHPAGG